MLDIDPSAILLPGNLGEIRWKILSGIREVIPQIIPSGWTLHFGSFSLGWWCWSAWPKASELVARSSTPLKAHSRYHRVHPIFNVLIQFQGGLLHCHLPLPDSTYPAHHVCHPAWCWQWHSLSVCTQRRHMAQARRLSGV